MGSFSSLLYLIFICFAINLKRPYKTMCMGQFRILDNWIRGWMSLVAVSMQKNRWSPINQYADSGEGGWKNRNLRLNKLPRWFWCQWSANHFVTYWPLRKLLAQWCCLILNMRDHGMCAASTCYQSFKLFGTSWEKAPLKWHSIAG